MTRLLVDTDTASDDAIALIMALRTPGIEVEAVTVVAGNVPLERAVQNALYTVELCGSEVPVYAGAAGPLVRQLATAEAVHGADGMGDIGLPLTGRTPAGVDAVRVLIDAVRRCPGALTLVTLGPLTNVALAVLSAPDIVPLLHRVVVMGGTGQGPGNVTPAAEFNIWVDPEAADVVFRAGLPLEMVGWDVSRAAAILSGVEQQQLRSLGPLGSFCVDIQRALREFCRRNGQQPDLPDPLAMAVALDERVATQVVRRHVAVETKGEHTRGATVVDALAAGPKAPNTSVVLAASHERFLELLSASLLP